MNFDAGSDQYESSLCILVQILMLHDLHIYILNFCDKTLKLSYNSAASLKVKKHLFLFRFTFALLHLFLFIFGSNH